jgi:hypothetical protein
MSKIKKKNWYIEHQKISAKARAAHKLGFKEGSAVTMLTAYLAIKDYGLPGIQWLSDRMSAAVSGKKPPLSNYEIDKAVTASVIESMRRYSPARAAEIEKSFQEFLTT